MSIFDALPAVARPEATPCAFSASRVQESHSLAFYHLIQEQAAQHGAAEHDPNEQVHADRLYRTAIVERGIEAFVLNNRANQSVAAVTYIPCQTELGAGLYLEDIVTTHSMRGHGLGHMAISVLAQIACARQSPYLMWECAEDNHVAQSFYRKLGAVACDDRHTWRYLGAATGSQNLVSDVYNYRPMRVEDTVHAVHFLARSAQSIEPHWDGWLRQQAEVVRPDAFFRIAEDARTNEVVGFAYGYRSYSTFRTVSGLHVNGFFVDPRHDDAANCLLDGLAREQKARGIDGHTDVTVKADQERFLEKLQGLSYEPLTYADSKMTVLAFDAAQLELVARLFPVPNLADICGVRRLAQIPHAL